MSTTNSSTMMTSRRAALLLRGRLPPAEHLKELSDSWLDKVVCPFRRQLGLHVDVFLATYGATIPDDFLRALDPISVTMLPFKNSTNFKSTVAVLLAFWTHATIATAGAIQQRGRPSSAIRSSPYELVILTRPDLRLKHAITALPGAASWSSWTRSVSPSSALPWRGRFFFVHKEGVSVWRDLKQRGVCFTWVRYHRTSDNMHLFDAELTPCMLRTLERYFMRRDVRGFEESNLHYLHDGMLRYVKTSNINFMVNGCYDSNPFKGQFNPVYDLVPRHLCYAPQDAGTCNALADFKDDCCPSSTYCCPNSLGACPAASSSSGSATNGTTTTMSKYEQVSWSARWWSCKMKKYHVFQHEQGAANNQTSSGSLQS